MGYFTIATWYSIMFQLRHMHHYNDADILQWAPYERDVYIDMIKKLQANK